MDLISVLVITYIAQGHSIESEMQMDHGQCVAAETAIVRSLAGPIDGRPTVELVGGGRVPVLSASCLPACPADGNEPLTLI